MKTALCEDRVDGILDHDERRQHSLLSDGSQVLLESIRVLWNGCRLYKIVGTSGPLNRPTTRIHEGLPYKPGNALNFGPAFSSPLNFVRR